MDIREEFEAHFNAKPAFVARAPGRVNLIGEHTDYNEGFVLPMAMDRAVRIALRPRDDTRVRLFSLDLELAADFKLDSLSKGSGWIEYVKGTAWALQKHGFDLRGWDGVMTGDVPRGAGLSSSAAVELAAARAFAAASGIAWDAKEMAKIAQAAENNWVGVNCGIMDQMASAVSKEGHALFLDCRSLEYQQVPFPEGTAVVVMDTSTRRGLVNSAYNERRNQCEEAARYFGVKALRDVSMETLEEKGRGKGLDATVFRRARHVVTENQRVLEAMAAMRAGDVQKLGKLFNQSHASLRDDFEVTNAALNQIVESAVEQEGCYGARMTGAGFGGCAVALVEQKKAQAFAGAVRAAFRQKSGLEAGVYICQAGEGANLI